MIEIICLLTLEKIYTDDKSFPKLRLNIESDYLHPCPKVLE